jgi:hypothetical protein
MTRVGTPVPGKQGKALEFMKKRAAALEAAYGVKAKLHYRIGGPLGQMELVSHHKNLQELEDIRRRIIEDTASGKLPISEEGTFQSVEDRIWLTD